MSKENWTYYKFIIYKEYLFIYLFMYNIKKSFEYEKS